MDRSDVQRWLDAYIEAWRANRPEPIAALFTDDIVYRYRPYGADEHSVSGNAAVVESWLEAPDEPGTWEAEYTAYAADGDRAVAIGWSRYHATADRAASVYHNCYLLRFDAEGRCAELTEFYMEEPAVGS